MPSIVITVGSADVTADVLFDTARFKSLVNGQAGEAFMRVRDLDSTYSFTEGSDWLLTVDGDAVWRGYVTAVKRTYIYPAGNVVESGLQRFWDLTGADLNILFERRVVYDQADPDNVTGPQFAAGTADTVAITELIDDWLYLNDDDLDTTTGIVGVGDLDPEQPTRAWSASWYWGAAMASIATIPAAIFYIRPEAGSPRGTLVYCDVDVPDAPFGLSDQPNGTTTKGFREMEIIEDGTSLANDVLAIGMGYGKQVPVVKRLQAAASITEHGRWQTGLQKPGVYKQATINRIADSVVNGSPESKRGSKDDRPAVQLTTYEPGLLAGHKVTFTSAVWGWTDVIPVRQMEITFESPTDPRYEILLSHEIDAPWGFIDQFWPKIPIPEWCPDPPCFVWPPPPPPVCDCEMPIPFDDFDRTEASGWGTATPSGKVWTQIIGMRAGTSSVSGGNGIMFTAGRTLSAFEQNVYMQTTIPAECLDAQFYCTTRFSVDTVLATDQYSQFLITFGGVSLGLDFGVQINISNDVSIGRIIAAGDSTGTYLKSDWVANTEYTCEVFFSGVVEVRVWESSGSRPAAPMASTTFSGDMTSSAFAMRADNIASSPIVYPQADITTRVENIVFELDRCVHETFDDFEDRTETNGWGDASGGYPWVVGPGVATSPFGVTSGYGYADQSVSGGDLTIGAGAYLLPGDPVTSPYEVTFEFVQDFQTTQPAGGPFFYDNVFYISDSYDLSGDWAGVEIYADPNTQFGIWRMSPFHPVATDNYQEDTFNTGAGLGTDETPHLYVKIKLDQYGVWVKLWFAADAEPSAWMAYQTDNAPMTAGTFVPRYVVLQPRQNGQAGTAFRLFDVQIAYADGACYYDGTTPVDPTGGIPLSPTGYGCEEPTRSSSTVYTTSTTFQPNTTFVWRDGLFQRRGTDYTEGSGSITFSDAVASTSVIRMCYFAEAAAT